MTCCWRAVMDQQLSEDWISSTAPGPAGRPDRQNDRSQHVRRGRQRNTKSASVLGKAWHGQDGGDGSCVCWECQCTAQTAISPCLLWLAKQIISFLIMISRVIIYTKVAHSPILAGEGAVFSLGQEENSTFSCVLPKMNGGTELLFSEKQSRPLFVSLSYSLCDNIYVFGGN